MLQQPLKSSVLVLVVTCAPWLAGCGKDASHYYMIGLDWHKEDKPEEAVASLTRALQLDPDHAEAYYFRALNRQKEGAHDEAMSDYERAAELLPRDARVFSGRASLWRELGDLDRAIADATASLQLDETYAAAYFQRGLAHMAKENFEEAVSDFRNHQRYRDRQGGGIDDELVDAWVFSETGRALLALGDIDEAYFNYGRSIPIYDEAIRRAPKFQTIDAEGNSVWHGKQKYDRAAEAHVGRARIYLIQGDAELALNDAAKAIRLRPELTDAYLYHALALAQLDRFMDAKKQLQTAIDQTPDRADIYDQLAWIAATCSQELDRDGVAAVSHATRACEMTNYKNYIYLETLAAAYAESGNWDKALQWQNEALRIAPDDKKEDRRIRLELYEAKQPYRGSREL